MKDFVNQFIELEREISQDKGDFTLFALFLREDGIGQWDVAVAAPWIELDRYEALELIAKKIQSTLSKEDIVRVSRVAIIHMNNTGLKAITRTVQVEHGDMELHDQVFFGMQMKHSHIITSRKLLRKKKVSVS
jgi:hypothetical protein